MPEYNLVPELPQAAIVDLPLVVATHHMDVLLTTLTVVLLKVQEWVAAGLHLLATLHQVDLLLQAILHLAALQAVVVAEADLQAVVAAAEAAVN